MKLKSAAANFNQARTDLRKPLTAFKASEVMLDRDPERHVGLMPAKYAMQNELEDTGSLSAY